MRKSDSYPKKIYKVVEFLSIELVSEDTMSGSTGQHNASLLRRIQTVLTFIMEYLKNISDLQFY